MALTKKQKMFIEEYLIDLNATQAAIRAGYSPATAKDIGCENLAKPNIRVCIDRAMAERSKRTGANAARVVEELAKIAFVNTGEVIDTKNAMIKDSATDEDKAAIQSVKVKTFSTESGDSVEREIKMADKIKALELLGKHLGMWNDKVDMTVHLPTFIDHVPEEDL